MIDYREIRSRWTEYRAAYPSQRAGQALFNVAAQMSEAVWHLAGTDEDPFYRDERIPAFFLAVTGKEWE